MAPISPLAIQTETLSESTSKGSNPLKARNARQDRSEKTRQKLIEVAIETIGSVGFEAATTRNISKKSGANLVSIQYYFGNKQGLRRAATQFIAEQIASTLQPYVLRIRQELGSRPHSHGETRELLIELLQALIRSTLSSRTPRSWWRFITREQSEPTAPTDLIFCEMRPVLELCTELIGMLCGHTVCLTEPRLQVVLVLSMAKCFHTERAMVMTIMGWTEIGESELQEIEGGIRHNIGQLFPDVQ